MHLVPSYFSQKSRSWLWLGLILSGLALRIQQYLAPRPLWLDEVMLAVGIRNCPWTSLHLPLEYYQVAPYGVLLLQRLSIGLAPTSAWSARLVPFLFSILGLCLIFPLVRKMLHRTHAYVALGLYAFSCILIFYSAEAKPYGIDASLSLLMIWLCTQAQAHGRWTLMTIVGIIGTWLSFPLIFILAACLLALLVSHFRQRRRWLQLFLIGILWLGSALMHMSVLERSPEGIAFMQKFWAWEFITWPWTYGGIIRWIGGRWLRLYTELMELPIFIGFIIWPLVFFAVGRLVKQRAWSVLILCLAPVSLHFLSTAFELYPFFSRLLLYAWPGCLILLAHGITDIASIFRNQRLRLTIALSAVLLVSLWPMVPKLWQDGFFYPYPPQKSHLVEALTFLQDELSPDQRLYVYDWGGPGFRYYAPAYIPAYVPVEIGRPTILNWDGCWQTEACRDTLFALDWRLFHEDLQQQHGLTWLLIQDPLNKPSELLEAKALMQDYLEDADIPILRACYFSEVSLFLVDFPIADSLPVDDLPSPDSVPVGGFGDARQETGYSSAMRSPKSTGKATKG